MLRGLSHRLFRQGHNDDAAGLDDLCEIDIANSLAMVRKQAVRVLTSSSASDGESPSPKNIDRGCQPCGFKNGPDGILQSFAMSPILGQ